MRLGDDVAIEFSRSLKHMPYWQTISAVLSSVVVVVVMVVVVVVVVVFAQNVRSVPKRAWLERGDKTCLNLTSCTNSQPARPDSRKSQESKLIRSESRSNNF